MREFIDLLRELASAEIWSSGVEVARNSQIFGSAKPTTEGDNNFRIVQGARDRVINVSINLGDQAWQSDCDCQDDPCRHVIGTTLALNQGKVSIDSVRRSSQTSGRVVYSFYRQGARLGFSRWIEWGDTRVEILGSLNAALATIPRGGPAVGLSQEDERVDYVLPHLKRGVLDPIAMQAVCAVLASSQSVELDGAPIALSSAPVRRALEVVDEGSDLVIRFGTDPEVSEIFENGLAIKLGTLVPLSDAGLTAEEWRAFNGAGRRFSSDKFIELASEIVPELEGRCEVVVRSSRLPRVKRATPRILIETVCDSGGTSLTAIPRLVYGDPQFAEVINDRVEVLPGSPLPIRERIAEAQLARELSSKLSLKFGEARAFVGEAGILFAQKLQGWETSGGAHSIFTPAQLAQRRISFDPGGASLSFATLDGRIAEGHAILSAWTGGSRFVQLNDGAWAELPIEWLAEHKDAALRLLNAKCDGSNDSAGGFGRAAEMCALEEVCDSLNLQLPDHLTGLRSWLTQVDSIPDAALPADLGATLRLYQRKGVNWLSLLKSHQLGALLADDMGLGKTLQAMCIMEGRVLVVAPTSVLYGWEEQLARFRPALRVCRYHGPDRHMDTSADLILTTYALLRMEIASFEAEMWDTIVLDESQTIRNPDSQIARAAYRLKGRFKLALSGTPVENSLEDLWSQFNFINPGLLGSRGEFEEGFANGIRGGDTALAQKLRRRISPFMLRRLKRDVAVELPPKTEVVVECELSDSERGIYSGILAASRPELVRAISEGTNQLTILEVLLRLRQACCHSSLIPGQSAASSSKVDLLIECLLRSTAQGHRALVFSQWTSLLDLVEGALKECGLDWLRIDGATQNRDVVVTDFQKPDGPPVLLLSLKAGGVGLNLTAADHVYILDPWWNPAVEDQAADRAYRIGQEKPVIVHRLVARGTIEERVMELQSRKRELLAAAVAKSPILGLSKAELLGLLDA